MKGVLFLLVSLFAIISFAQEIKCDVSVLAPTLKSDPANTEIMKELQSSVYEFINSQKWTEDNFLEEEKIDMSILININSKSGSNYTGSIQVSSSRPVLYSDYKTRLVNFNDEKLTFVYERGQALIFTPDRHLNNLSDVVAYYVYMVLGFDYDSYSLKGGTKYFMKAQQIVGRCQNAREPGWKPTEGKKNRFSIVDNTLNNAFVNLRTCSYNYHRKGFDRLYSSNEEAVTEVVNALKSLQIIHKTQPNSVNVQMFFSAKADEIVSMFKDADDKTKNQVYVIVAKLDPGNISKYNKMKK